MLEVEPTGIDANSRPPAGSTGAEGERRLSIGLDFRPRTDSASICFHGENMGPGRVLGDMNQGNDDGMRDVANRIAADAAAVEGVLGMMALPERRSAALALHSDGLTMLTRALRDLQRAADAPDPVFWLQSALEHVHTAVRVVERLGEKPELLRSR